MDTFLSKDTKAQVAKDVRPIVSDTEAVEKIGWTDEARAAAAANRKGRGQMSDMHHAVSRWGWGMSHSEQDAKGNLTRHYAHPDDDRQRVSIQPNGKWQHTTNGFPTASGSGGAPELGAHLAQFHGDPSGQASHDEMLSNAKPNRKLSVPERHQHRIAQQTLRMSPAMAGVMGGPNHQESRAILSRNTGLPAHPEPKASPYDDPNSPQSRNAAADSRRQFEATGGYRYPAKKAEGYAETETVGNGVFKPLAADAEVQIGGPSVPRETAKFPTPKIINLEGDQDDIYDTVTYAPDGVFIPGKPAGKNQDIPLFKPTDGK